MRTRKKKWTDQELDGNPLILRGDTSAYFMKAHAEDSRALHLELGCGKGRFITEMARRNPGVRFVGVERAPIILASAARHAFESTRGSDNAPLFLIAEASELTEIFAPGMIRRLYLNFCDPWPNKKKWAKRRLTHGNFLKLYEQLLIKEIHFKTDSRPLFEFSLESFSEHDWKLRNISLDLHNSGMEDNVMTEYERKFSLRGLPIYRLEAYKG